MLAPRVAGCAVGRFNSGVRQQLLRPLSVLGTPVLSPASQLFAVSVAIELSVSTESWGSEAKQFAVACSPAGLIALGGDSEDTRCDSDTKTRTCLTASYIPREVLTPEGGATIWIGKAFYQCCHNRVVASVSPDKIDSRAVRDSFPHTLTRAFSPSACLLPLTTASGSTSYLLNKMKGNHSRVAASPRFVTSQHPSPQARCQSCASTSVGVPSSTLLTCTRSSSHFGLLWKVVDTLLLLDPLS